MLSAVSAALDWAALEALLAPIYAAPTGRPSYPVATMLRVTLLQAWWGLSDPQIEDQLRDRLSFRRFAGLAVQGAVPDHTTIFRFREQLDRVWAGRGLVCRDRPPARCQGHGAARRHADRCLAAAQRGARAGEGRTHQPAR